MCRQILSCYKLLKPLLINRYFVIFIIIAVLNIGNSYLFYVADPPKIECKLGADMFPSLEAIFIVFQIFIAICVGIIKCLQYIVVAFIRKDSICKSLWKICKIIAFVVAIVGVLLLIGFLSPNNIPICECAKTNPITCEGG